MALSPRTESRVAGLFYLVTFATGIAALIVRGTVGAACGVVAGISYIAVTLLIYDLLKPVNKAVAAMATAVSLTGIVVGLLQIRSVNPLVFFGIYCLLLAYLILASTVLPRIVGALLVLAGAGWLTFLSPAIAKSLYPYNLAPGVIGEAALTVLLLVGGVDVDGRRDQANEGRRSAGSSPGRFRT